MYAVTWGSRFLVTSFCLVSTKKNIYLLKTEGLWKKFLSWISKSVITPEGCCIKHFLYFLASLILTITIMPLCFHMDVVINSISQPWISLDLYSWVLPYERGCCIWTIMNMPKSADFTRKVKSIVSNKCEEHPYNIVAAKWLNV